MPNTTVFDQAAKAAFARLTEYESLPEDVSLGSSPLDILGEIRRGAFARDDSPAFVINVAGPDGKVNAF